MAKGTRVMRDQEGNVYDIPFGEVEKAMKSGLQLTTQMADEKGGLYDIPEMEVAAAREAGLKPLTSEKSPFEKEKDTMAAGMQKYPTAAKVARGVADVVSPIAAGIESVGDFLVPGSMDSLRAERIRKAEMFDQLPGGGRSAARTAGQVGAVVVPAVVAAPAQTVRVLAATPVVISKAGRATGRFLYGKAKTLGDYITGGIAGYYAGKAAGAAEKQVSEVLK